MHYALLYPKNGDRIVTIDSVTSLHSTYSYGNTLSNTLHVTQTPNKKS